MSFKRNRKEKKKDKARVSECVCKRKKMVGSLITEKGKQRLVFALILTCTALFSIVFYGPYYTRRVVRYKHHAEIVNSLVCEGLLKREPELQRSDVEFLKRMHVESLSYNGVRSNCFESSVYVRKALWIGAFEDMWQDSMLRVLLTADHIVLKVAYLALLAVIVVSIGRGIISYLTNVSVADRIFNGQQTKHDQSSNKGERVLKTSSGKSIAFVRKRTREKEHVMDSHDYDRDQIHY